MKYGKRTPEENASVANWVPGHTDLGSFTLLFRQPVAGLQIRYHSTDEWKWVKPQDATLTVNACDALQFLTGGYVKSTIHRQVVHLFLNVKRFNEFVVSLYPRKINNMSIVLDYYTFLGHITMSVWILSKSRLYFNERGILRTNLRKVEVLSRPWKASSLLLHKRGLQLIDCAEWTFAKQKWQRTKGYSDKSHKTAVILPGFQEKVYA